MPSTQDGNHHGVQGAWGLVEVTPRTLVAVLAAASLLGVGTLWLVMAGSPPPSPAGAQAPPAGGSPSPPATGGNFTAMALALQLVTDRPVYSLGDTVKVTITLTNVGDEVATLGLPDPCSVVFLVYDGNGQPAYNSTKNVGCIQVWWDLTLKPGASQMWHYSWNTTTDSGDPVPAPASYELIPSFVWGRLYQDRVVCTETATIAVEP